MAMMEVLEMESSFRDPHEWQIDHCTMPPSATCVHCGVFRGFNPRKGGSYYVAANGWSFGAALPQCRRNQGLLPRKYLPSEEEFDGLFKALEAVVVGCCRPCPQCGLAAKKLPDGGCDCSWCGLGTSSCGRIVFFDPADLCDQPKDIG